MTRQISKHAGAASRDDDIAKAIEVFARGFAFTRSFTHPYLAERVGLVWVVRDAPRKNPRDYRKEEWIAHGVGAAEVDRLARSHTRGRFAVCAIRGADEPDAPLRAAYKSLGYRLQTTEPFMIHRLKRIPRFACPVDVQRVTTRDLAERVAKAAESRQMLDEHVGRDDAPLRQYVALDGDAVVGWVRSIVVGDRTWVSNMHVLPTYRRRGIGRAMLAKLLRDDRDHGSRASVLLASHTGAKLYPVVGYEFIGELLLFTPRRVPTRR
jgi:GNAT superfamily N-acetyltransferase